MTLEQILQQAMAAHQAGEWADGERLYRHVLAINPRHPSALHLLGVMAGERGQPQTAIELIGRAIAIFPGEAMYHVNMGIFLAALQRRGEALAAYRHALRLNPALADAHMHAGVALLAEKRAPEAEAALREALRLRPDFAEAWLALGNALHAQGQTARAIESLQHALTLRPNYADALCNIAGVLQSQGDISAATARCEEALRIDPHHAGAWNLRGALHLARGDLKAALEHCRRAATLNPQLADAHNNLGIALRLTGNADDAIAAYREAVRLRPDFAQAYNNLGIALQMQGRLDDAMAALQQAIALNPRAADTHLNLGSAYVDRAELDNALGAYQQAIALTPDDPTAHSNLLFSLIFNGAYDDRAMLAEARRWAARHADPLKPLIRPHTNSRAPQRKLRIGYVSPEFRNHVQAHFTLPLLSHHDRNAFHIIAYSGTMAPDEITARLRACCDDWRDTAALSDAQLADLIRHDQIDILFDLTMHMSGSRLGVFARKPAPVQVAWLAYPGTTGVDAIDYRLSDPYLDPFTQSDRAIEKLPQYSETTCRLPHTFWCFDPLSEETVAPPPAETHGHITFGCLNNFCKLNGETLSLWAQILGALPTSRLLMLAPAGSARQRTRDHLQLQGIAPDRVDFVARAPRAAYLRHYHRIDIALDTLPANGHTTSLDALWMGVPVITLAGRTISGRAGLSQLNNLNLPELLAHTPRQFVEAALSLAENIDRLRTLRSTLRQRLRASPLMNAPLFTQHFESACRAMWRKWCGVSPV